MSGFLGLSTLHLPSHSLYFCHCTDSKFIHIALAARKSDSIRAHLIFCQVKSEHAALFAAAASRRAVCERVDGGVAAAGRLPPQSSVKLGRICRHLNGPNGFRIVDF